MADNPTNINATHTETTDDITVETKPDGKGSNLIDAMEALSMRDSESTTNPKWYFNGAHWFLKTLRFLNLLEPGPRVILSLTKVMLWGATIQSFLVISTSSDWLTVSGALGMNVATMLKHETRRKSQVEHGAVETSDGE